MVHIIKSGNQRYVATLKCTICSCVFEAEWREVHTERATRAFGDGTINCPECNDEVSTNFRAFEEPVPIKGIAR